jgi:uncharacterized membrane-anchored protein YitT (DUF2179 family)
VIYILQRVFAVFIGSLLLSMGINGFLVPHHLLDGGITGIALVLHYYTGFPTGLSLFLLSTPLCIYTWIYRRIYFYNSALGLMIVSISIDLFEPLKSQFMLSIFTSALFGGGFHWFRSWNYASLQDKHWGNRPVGTIYIGCVLLQYRNRYFNC